MALEERVLAAYYDRLTAFAIDKSRVITIEFQSADPELAARGANVIAEKYLSLQQVAKQDQARSAGQWLSGELEKLRSKVSEAEAKVEDYRAKSNLFVGSNNTSLVNQQLTELSSQVSAARAQKADAEARARQIREALRSGQALDSSDVTNSELIRRLSEQRVTLRAQLAEQSSTLLPQHPRIKEMRAQIADLDQQIRAEGDRLVRSLESEAKVAGARLETLSANLDQFKRQTASTSDQDVQLRALEREAKAQRDLFESYLAKYREATARDSIAAAPADARIISRAVVSNIPYFPKKMPIVLIAALGTFCLATAFVVTGALLSGETYRPAPSRRPTPVRVVAARRRRASAPMPGAAPATGCPPRPICRLPAVQAPPVAAAAAPRRHRGSDDRRYRRGLASVGRGRPQHCGDRQRARRRHDAHRDRAGARAGAHRPRGAGRSGVRLAEHRRRSRTIRRRPAWPNWCAGRPRSATSSPATAVRGRIWSPPGRSATMPPDCSNRRCCGPPSARCRRATIIW